jgi:hypothetical protein
MVMLEVLDDSHLSVLESPVPLSGHSHYFLPIFSLSDSILLGCHVAPLFTLQGITTVVMLAKILSEMSKDQGHPESHAPGSY